MFQYRLSRIDKILYYRNRIMFHNWLLSSLYSRVRYYHRNKDIKEALSSVVKRMDNTANDIDWKRDKSLVLDFLFCKEYYSISFEEYILFGFPNKNRKERKEYVGWSELDYYDMSLNEYGRPDVFESKAKTYEVFQSFYRREVVMIESEHDKDKAESFFARHGAGIIKPDDDYGGHGVSIYRASENLPFESIWQELSRSIPFVLEEVINQAPEMNAFSPFSVNTIRYNTFFYKDNLTRLQAVLRMGTGNSEVDNASSGGIFALIDINTGCIIGPARNLKGEVFERHPDTGIQFDGCKIPCWDELNQMLETIVRVVPEQIQVGWDLALSDKGWVIIEGNTTPMFQKFDPQHGLRELISNTYGKVVKMWSDSN